MKFAIVIPDGAADWPTDSLGGKTPFEVARVPNMDRIAREGRLGTVRYAPPDLPPGSDVCILSLVGYDPAACYTGRAPIEAVAQGIPLEETDWVFRMNLVTVVDGEMVDYSAGHITTREAALLVDALQDQLGRPGLRFYAGVGYRHLLVVQGEEFKVRTTPPHDIMGEPIRRHMPKGRNAKRLVELMHASVTVLEDHPVNRVRTDLGESPATQVWFWGEGRKPRLEWFETRWGLKGAAITAVDLVRGIAKLIGWDVIEVEGATGYYDTNYAGKGQAAVRALAERDLVLVHVEATDEAGHNGDAHEKVRALEEIDANVVGPVLEALEAGGEDWRVLVSPDHLTPIDLRTHHADPVPFAMMGTGLKPLRPAEAMTEACAAGAGMNVEVGHELMEYFLKR